MDRRVPLKRVRAEGSELENMKSKWSKLDESVDKMLLSQRWMIDSDKFYLQECRSKFVEIGLLPLFGFDPVVRIVSGMMAIFFSAEEWREFLGYRSAIASFFEEDADAVLESLSFKDFRLSFVKAAVGEDFEKLMYVRCRTVEIFLNRKNVEQLFELEKKVDLKLRLLKRRNFKAYAARINLGAMKTGEDVLEALRKDDKENPVNKLSLLGYYSHYLKKK